MGGRRPFRVPRAAPVAALAFLGLFAGAPLRAAGIELRLDRLEASLHDQIVLTVVVEGARDARPELPPLADFEVYAGGQSSQFTFVNGRSSSTVSYTYHLLPRAVGTFTIAPASVEIDGQLYQSRPVSVRVVEGAAEPERAEDVFATAQVSNATPYVGEQVIYTWRLYRRVRIGDARLEPQDFGGFLVEDLGDVREYEATVRGRAYLVSEMRKALFPQEEGGVEVPGSRLGLQVLVRENSGRSLFDDFFGQARAESRVLRTDPIPLEVRPLPPAPAGFSGLVGQFEIAAKAGRREVKVGESVTVELSIRGTGNVQMIGEPPLPPLPSIKVYDDKPSADLDRSGPALRGGKSFRKAIVPLAPGPLTIPALELTYFDTDADAYATVHSEPISFSVAPGEADEELRLTELAAPTTGKVAVRILADDILPIHRGAGALGRPARAGAELLWLTGLLLPAGLYLLAAAVERRRRRGEVDVAWRRRRLARRRVRRGLRDLALAGEGADEAASRCLRDYVGDKLGVEGGALTPPETERALLDGGAGGELAGAVRALLERLEAARYGAGGPMAGRELSERVEKLVARLERGLR